MWRRRESFHTRALVSTFPLLRLLSSITFNLFQKEKRTRGVEQNQLRISCIHVIFIHFYQIFASFRSLVCCGCLKLKSFAALVGSHVPLPSNCEVLCWKVFRWMYRGVSDTKKHVIVAPCNGMEHQINIEKKLIKRDKKKQSADSQCYVPSLRLLSYGTMHNYLWAITHRLSHLPWSDFMLLSCWLCIIYYSDLRPGTTIKMRQTGCICSLQNKESLALISHIWLDVKGQLWDCTEGWPLTPAVQS